MTRIKTRTTRQYNKSNTNVGNVISTSGPYTVPADFLGMCFMEYPSAGVNPLTTVAPINWKSMRMNQMYESRWSTLEVAACFGYISGSSFNILNVTSVIGGPIAVGMIIQCVGITPGTTIISGSGNTWTITPQITALGTNVSQPTLVSCYSVSALTTLDNIITFQRAAGANLYFGTYCTPLFYANSITNNPTYPDSTARGPWNVLAECAVPFVAGSYTFVPYTNFTTLIVQRYNSTSGIWYQSNNSGSVTTYNPLGLLLGKGIQYWEPWNEPPPNFPGNGVTSAGAQSSNFFWGTASQLTDLSYAQYLAVKNADPTVQVSTPAFAGFSGTQISSFMSQSGTLGATGIQSCDAISFHPYNMNPYGVTYGNSPYWSNDLITGYAGFNTINSSIGSYGLPLWFGEVGISSSNGDSTLSSWYYQQIISITCTGSANPYTATITTAIPHQYLVGDIITVQGIYPTNYNGTYTITSILSANTFTFNMPTNPGTTGTYTGAITTSSSISGNTIHVGTITSGQIASYQWVTGGTALVDTIVTTGSGVTWSSVCSNSSGQSVSSTTLNFNGSVSNQSFRYRWIARWLMTIAAHGVKMIQPWLYNGTYNDNPPNADSGWWPTDYYGVVAAYNNVSTNVVNKTIISSSYIANGPVTLKFSDGSSWTV